MSCSRRVSHFPLKRFPQQELFPRNMKLQFMFPAWQQQLLGAACLTFWRSPENSGSTGKMSWERNVNCHYFKSRTSKNTEFGELWMKRLLLSRGLQSCFTFAQGMARDDLLASPTLRSSIPHRLLLFTFSEFKTLLLTNTSKRKARNQPYKEYVSRLFGCSTG